MVVKRVVFAILGAALAVGCQPGQSNRQHADRNEFYRDVQTAKVIVRETYGAHKGISLPFRSYAESWLRMANVAVAADDAAPADCLITIVAQGEPLKAGYGSRILFTGARITGSIRIERPKRHAEEVRFSGFVGPPRDIPAGAVDYTRPENAPFLIPLKQEGADARAKAAFDGFALQLASLMGRYFGRTVLLIALDDYPSKGAQRESAIGALAALGKPAVPYLVDAFIYCSPEAEKGLGEALERITGKNFGSSARKWTEWYARQQKNGH